MTMTEERYSDFVGQDTDDLSIRDADLLAGLGMGGEGGEVCDFMKKLVFHHKTYDRGDLLKEMGDVLWYMTLIMRRHGMSIEEIMETNVRKLCHRYPDRYGLPSHWIDTTEVPPRPRGRPFGDDKTKYGKYEAQ